VFSRVIAAEFFKASRRWSLLFWGFAFVPLCSFAVGVLLLFRPIKAAEIAPRVDLFFRLTRSLEITGSPLAQVFFAAAAAVIFGSEYESETWRVLAPRAHRGDWILAKALLYATVASASLILVAIGACFCALFGSVRLRLPIVWQAEGIYPAAVVAIVFGVSWLELVFIGLATGLIAVVSRSVLVAAVSAILAAFCQSLLISAVSISRSSVVNIAALPGLSAEAARLFVTHTQLSPGEFVTQPEAVTAALSLLVWIVLTLGFTVMWFKRQEIQRE
jgi:ABC-type transport system involved in multi-copper enzyme maturation permease subunit